MAASKPTTRIATFYGNIAPKYEPKPVIIPQLSRQMNSSLGMRYIERMISRNQSYTELYYRSSISKNKQKELPNSPGRRQKIKTNINTRYERIKKHINTVDRPIYVAKSSS